MSTPTSNLAAVNSWLFFAIPALYLAAAAVVASAPGARAARAWGRASALSGAAVATAGALSLCAFSDPGARSVTDPFASLFGLSLDGTRLLSVRRDVLTYAMLLLVTFIGWVVVRFSRRYLDGDPQQLPYLRRLLLTLAAVCALVSSNNLLGIALLWLGTSLSLHGLLTHFADRTAAQIAAHKKFLLSRLADACLLGAVCLVGSALHTLELDRVFELVERAPSLPTEVRVACVLIALSVLLKCAQLPFHGWLIQVMEAPTPVSALLHAGVVNIGGFLLIRLAPLMARAQSAQTLLLLVGLATASVASLVMLTRISVKVMLAWSTCAQMGLMLVECALGAYEIALLHLLAHSLYKAHAFLGAGGAVVTQRVAAMAPPSRRLGVSVLFAAGASCLATSIAVLSVAGVQILRQPAHWFPLGLLSLALPSLLLNLPERGGLKGVAAAGSVLTVCFAASHLLFALLLPADHELAANEAVPAALAVLALIALFAVHTWLRERSASDFARWLYPRAFAGFYLDDLFTRLTFRIWPAKLQGPEQPSLLLPRARKPSPQ